MKPKPRKYREWSPNIQKLSNYVYEYLKYYRFGWIESIPHARAKRSVYGWLRNYSYNNAYEMSHELLASLGDMEGDIELGAESIFKSIVESDGKYDLGFEISSFYFDTTSGDRPVDIVKEALGFNYHESLMGVFLPLSKKINRPFNYILGSLFYSNRYGRIHSEYNVKDGINVHTVLVLDRGHISVYFGVDRNSLIAKRQEDICKAPILYAGTSRRLKVDCLDRSDDAHGDNIYFSIHFNDASDVWGPNVYPYWCQVTKCLDDIFGYDEVRNHSELKYRSAMDIYAQTAGVPDYLRQFANEEFKQEDSFPSEDQSVSEDQNESQDQGADDGEVGGTGGFDFLGDTKLKKILDSLNDKDSLAVDPVDMAAVMTDLDISFEDPVEESKGEGDVADSNGCAANLTNQVGNHQECENSSENKDSSQEVKPVASNEISSYFGKIDYSNMHKEGRTLLEMWEEEV